MFRKTFGTLTAAARGLETARLWLGHNSVSTTQAYLAADDDISDEHSQQIQSDTFAAFGD
jgi:integrase